LRPVAIAAKPADMADEEQERRGAGEGLTAETLAAIETALEAGDDAGVRARAEALHPADIADLFEKLDPTIRRRLAAALGPTLDAEVLAELNDWVRDELLPALSAEQVADAVADLDTDDAVAILEDLGPAEQQAVLDELDAPERAVLESALAYPEDSAGRLMQRDLVAVPEHFTIGDVIDFLRAGDKAQVDFWEVFVVDPGFRPVGTMRLSWILTAGRDRPVRDVMQREQTLIPVAMDQEEVARRFTRYALISAAVVDESGRLVGQITADDIVHIVSEEAGEDILKLSGAGEGDINEPVLDSYRARVRWLVANLGTALVSAFVISLFGGTIEELVVLAALSPVVASIGGNAGNQTMAVIVRALATGQLAERNARRTLVKELKVAGLNGTTIALILGIGVALVLEDSALGLVIGMATLFNILVAGLGGTLLPLALRRLGVDPAVASSVFVTFLTDVMGFFLFLGLAAWSGLASGLAGGR
jgi:magnesium transporter